MNQNTSSFQESLKPITEALDLFLQSYALIKRHYLGTYLDNLTALQCAQRTLVALKDGSAIPSTPEEDQREHISQLESVFKQLSSIRRNLNYSATDFHELHDVFAEDLKAMKDELKHIRGSIGHLLLKQKAMFI